jgi:DNA polymerase III delta prime subunit
MDTLTQPAYSDILKATRSFNIDQLNEYQQWFMQAVNELEANRNTLTFSEKTLLKQYRYQIIRIQGDMTRILEIKTKKQLERERTRAALNVLKASAALKVAQQSANELQIRNDVNPGRKAKVSAEKQIQSAEDELIKEICIKHNCTPAEAYNKLALAKVKAEQEFIREQKFKNGLEDNKTSILSMLRNPDKADKAINEMFPGMANDSGQSMRECIDCMAMLTPDEESVCNSCLQLKAIPRIKISE